MPPPFGLTSSIRSSRCRSFAVCRTTEANASLTSITAMSSSVRPAFATARSIASGLPCSIRVGSTPAMPNETKRARGSSPSRPTAASLAISTAAEPSTICDELPAVTTPSGRNAGLSAASAAAEVSRRGASSTANTAGAATAAPPACNTVLLASSPVGASGSSIGTISRSNLPPSEAASARRCDSSEYASSASRDRCHSSASSSAEVPCITISCRSVMRSEIEPPFEPIGTRDIISTPAETTRSSWPAITAAAALKLVCIDEPH